MKYRIFRGAGLLIAQVIPIWEALHPEGGRISPTPGGEQKIGFAADTGAVTGESKRRINEHLARAEALGDDLPRVTGTSLDKGVELDALAKQPSPRLQFSVLAQGIQNAGIQAGIQGNGILGPG